MKSMDRLRCISDGLNRNNVEREERFCILLLESATLSGLSRVRACVSPIRVPLPNLERPNHRSNFPSS